MARKPGLRSLGQAVYAKMLIESSRDINAMKQVDWIDVQTGHVSVSTVVYTEDGVSEPRALENPKNGSTLGLYNLNHRSTIVQKWGFYNTLYHIILYHTIVYYIILHYTILYYTIPYYISRYHIILYYTILHQSRIGTASIFWSLPGLSENVARGHLESEAGLKR